jgi:hypothetical protein
VVCDIDILVFELLAIKARARLVLPPPDGAEIMNSLPITEFLYDYYVK